MNHPYADILDHPHHVSQKHPPLSADSRAAQFSPFAALTGYDDTVREAARRTDPRIGLEADEIARIDRVLRRLQPGDPVRMTCFIPDERKAGGSYQPIAGAVKKLDALNGVLYLADGQSFPFEDIYAIQGGSPPPEEDYNIM